MTDVEDRKAVAAARARGAMILAIFGSLWCAGAVSLYGNDPASRNGDTAPVAGISIATAGALILYCWQVHRRLTPFARAWSKRIRRTFWMVNAVQYAALSLIVTLLNQGPNSRLLVPAGMAVVGLHFFPLARLFNSKTHAWIGGAMIITAGILGAIGLPLLSPWPVFSGGAILLGGAAALAAIASRENRR